MQLILEVLIGVHPHVPLLVLNILGASAGHEVRKVIGLILPYDIFETRLGEYCLVPAIRAVWLGLG